MFERARTSICVCYGDWSGNYGHTSIKQIWKRHTYAMALHRFAEGFMGIPGGEKPSYRDHSFQSHVDRVCPAFKKWYSFPTEINSSSPIKHKHIRSLTHHLHVQFQIRYRPGGCSNEHVWAFVSATIIEVGITVVPLSSKCGRGLLMPWHRIALRKVAWVYQVEKGPAATFFLRAIVCGWKNIL